MTTTSKKPLATGKKASARKTGEEAPPWERENPKADHPAHLTAPQKAAAKRAAKKAGRPYPNLVDNMRVARAATGKKTTTKK
jgi:hypothetical protein